MLKDKKLILVDLDGTALQDEKSLHPDNVKALKKAKELGHIVAIATGRPRRGSIKFYKELGLDTPMANYNGSHISNPSDKNYEDKTITIPSKVAKEILNLKDVKGNVVDVMCEFKDEVYTDGKTDIFLKWFNVDPNTDVIKMDVASKLKENVNSMLICINNEAGRKNIADYCKKNKDIIMRTWSVRPDMPGIVEINPATGHKGAALKMIAKEYNIPLKDTIAFGDMSNDIEMLQTAGIGVAMDNAHDSTKEVADVVMKKDHTQGAVAHWLNNHLLK